MIIRAVGWPPVFLPKITEHLCRYTDYCPMKSMVMVINAIAKNRKIVYN